MSVKNNIDDEYVPTNRERSHKAKRTQFWCPICDHALVAEGEHCPCCKKLIDSKKRKVT